MRATLLVHLLILCFIFLIISQQSIWLRPEFWTVRPPGLTSMALNDAEAWTLPKVDCKYLEDFEKWCWSRMEKISWTNCVRMRK
jgi:hypothetical protein